MAAAWSGDVIARRELKVAGKRSKVTVELAKPVKRKTGEFGCTYRIAFGADEKVMTIYGEDSFQAMLLALKLIPVELEHTDWLPSGMFWLEQRNGTGFEGTT